MTTKEMSIRIQEICETSFVFNKGLLPDDWKGSKISIGYSLNFQYDIDKNILDVKSIIDYYFDQDIIVELRFSFIVEIKDLKQFVVDSKGPKFNFPQEFMYTLVSEVYSSGRTMLHSKLQNTPLENEYLPFGGARNLYESVKEKIGVEQSVTPSGK